MDGVALLASGIVMGIWRPCRRFEGRAPRFAVALLLLSAASVWVGGFAVAVEFAARSGDALTACGVVWQQLLAGQLEWWRTLPLAAWFVLFPVRACAELLRHQIRNSVVAKAASQAGVPLSGFDAVAVHALGTPAVTVGLLNPRVVVDAQFWRDATPLDRAVVMAHERSHVRGRHALIEAAATFFIAPLRPVPAAADVYECVRRHLEALADDGAVRTHGHEAVGMAVGHVALQAYPPAGLGATGACVWRVQRLLAPTRASRRRDVVVMVGMVIMMVLMLASTGADAAHALGPVTGADFCPVSA